MKRMKCRCVETDEPFASGKGTGRPGLRCPRASSIRCTTEPGMPPTPIGAGRRPGAGRRRSARRSYPRLIPSGVEGLIVFADRASPPLVAVMPPPVVRSTSRALRRVGVTMFS